MTPHNDQRAEAELRVMMSRATLILTRIEAAGNSVRQFVDSGPTKAGPLFVDPWPVMNLAIALGDLLEIECRCWMSSDMLDAVEVAAPLQDAIASYISSIQGYDNDAEEPS